MSELSEVKIIGTGTISGGEYSEVSISGKAQANGDLICKEIKVIGGFNCKKNVECSGEFKSNGYCTVTENLKVKDLKTSGKFSVNGNLIVTGEMSTGGTIECKGKIRAAKIESTGSIKCVSDIEAENISIAGTLMCDGLVNAENLNLKMETQKMRVGSIGGGMITVYPGYTDNPVNKITPLKKVLKAINTGCKLVVSESIEGDIVNLECVEAPIVCGRIVILGDGCIIGKVQYTEKLEIAEGATVEEEIKI